MESLDFVGKVIAGNSRKTETDVKVCLRNEQLSLRVMYNEMVKWNDGHQL